MLLIWWNRQKLIRDGDDEASVAHFCLQELHILPSAFLSLPTEERAFITASCIVRGEEEEKALNKTKRRR